VAKLSQKAENTPKIAATAPAPSWAAQTAAISRKRPAEAVTIGIMAPGTSSGR
jgi:hypothetical protein